MSVFAQIIQKIVERCADYVVIAKRQRAEGCEHRIAEPVIVEERTAGKNAVIAVLLAESGFDGNSCFCIRFIQGNNGKNSKGYLPYFSRNFFITVGPSCNIAVPFSI